MKETWDYWFEVEDMICERTAIQPPADKADFMKKHSSTFPHFVNNCQKAESLARTGDMDTLDDKLSSILGMNEEYKLEGVDVYCRGLMAVAIGNYTHKNKEVNKRRMRYYVKKYGITQTKV